MSDTEILCLVHHREVEHGRFDSVLFVAGQARQAVGEGVGDAEFHRFSVSLGRWPKTNGYVSQIFRSLLDILELEAGHFQ